MTQLILASSSPRRQQLLTSIGVAYRVVKPNINESPRPNEKPMNYVRRLSLEKAGAAAVYVDGDEAVLAADTVVILSADTIGVTSEGEILGKPADADEARVMLQRLRGRPHQVSTAFTLLRRQKLPITQIVTTTVYMRPYTDAEIDSYIATGDPFDKAGSYAIQHEGFHPVERIDGSYSNVVGLPLDEVKAALLQVGLM
jgi:septum formation protein